MYEVVVIVSDSEYGSMALLSRFAENASCVNVCVVGCGVGVGG